MSQKHVTTCIDGTVRGYRGTSWKCTCGAGGAWAVRDGSAESDAYHHRLAVDPEFARAEKARKALWREEQDAILARNREATAARRAETEAKKAESPPAVVEMVLTEEFEHLAEDHSNCKFEEPGMPDAANEAWHDKSSVETAAVMNYELASVLQEQRDAAIEVMNAHRCGEKNESFMATLVEARAERDAALAAIERVRQAVAGHPVCDRYEEGDVISCGWKSAYASVLAALDGAPEPEWEPCTAEIHSWSKQAFHRNRDIDSYWIRCTLLGKHDEHEDSNTGLTWRSGLPVEGESKP